MDVVYIVRAGQNEELRFSLRALCANLPHDRLWAVGAGPDWLASNVGRIPTPQTSDKYGTTLNSLIAACKTRSPVGSPFILMDDDFFITAPIQTVPTLHCGELSKVQPQRRQVVKTLQILRRLGHREPLHYDLHAPMVVDKRAMLDALAQAVPHEGLMPKTAYGNLQQIGGMYSADGKVYSLDDGIPEDLPFVSTNDRTFGQGEAGRQIRAMFPEPSPYEQV